MSNDIEDLLDIVSDNPQWKVEKVSGTRWRIRPPNLAHDIISVSNSRDPHAIKNVRAQLRRAGFPFEEKTMDRRVVTPIVSGVVAAAQAPTPTVSPIERIKSDVDIMLGCLTRISESLGEIEQSEAAVRQLKQLLGSVLK